MIKSYVINLERNPERLKAMQTQFKRLGIPFERFPAVDGHHIGEQEFNEFINTRPLKNSGDSYAPDGRKWTPGSMGCFLSHYRLWSIAAQSPERFIAIFEDDLHIADSLQAFIQDDKWIPSECELIRFEPSYNRIKLASTPWTTVAGRKLSRVIPSNYEHCWPVGTGGYIISKKAAQRLVNTPERYHTHADIFLFNNLESPVAKQIVTGQLDPAPCIQDKFFHLNEKNIVHKSEIQISKAQPHKYSLASRLGRKLHSLRIVLLGYKKVKFRE